MPVDHYENFPVASWLLPARLRAPIEAVYGFARGADDVADEGDAPPAERLAALDGYRAALDAIERGDTPAGFERIARAVRDHRLPIPLLRDLIDAFRQDVLQTRYATFADLLDYARRSANPVGRLVLAIMGSDPQGGWRPPAEGAPTPWGSDPFIQSDRICTALQLINFWQDVAIDWAKGRVYIPQEDLARFGVDEAQIAAGRADGRWGDLMRFECQRAREMLREGAPLGRALPGRLGVEIRATIAGGATILDKIDAVSGDVFRYRPKLGAADWARIIMRSVIPTPGTDPNRSQTGV